MDPAKSAPRRKWPSRTVQRQSSQLAVIVKGPPSLLSAEEYIYQQGVSKANASLFIRLDRNNPYQKKERMEEIICDSEWREVTYYHSSWKDHRLTSAYQFLPSNIGRTLRRLVRLLRLIGDRRALDKLARRHGPSETVLCGHTVSELHLAARLNPERCILIDSGSTVTKWQQHGKFPVSSHALAACFSVIGIRRVENARLSIFTTSPASVVPNMDVISNTLALKRQEVQGKTVGNEVFIVGKIPVFLQRAEWSTAIREMLEAVDARGKKIIYVPHPGGREPSERILELAELFNCDVDDRLIPIELKVVNRPNLPHAILGFGSTSLKHFATIFGDSVRIVSAWNDQWAVGKPKMLEAVELVRRHPNIELLPVKASAT